MFVIYASIQDTEENNVDANIPVVPLYSSESEGNIFSTVLLKDFRIQRLDDQENKKDEIHINLDENDHEHRKQSENITIQNNDEGSKSEKEFRSKLNLSFNISDVTKLFDSKNLVKNTKVNNLTEMLPEVNDEGNIFDDESKNYANENQYSFVNDRRQVWP